MSSLLNASLAAEVQLSVTLRTSCRNGEIACAIICLAGTSRSVPVALLRSSFSIVLCLHGY
jgi:hypothetical protein